MHPGTRTHVPFIHFVPAGSCSCRLVSLLCLPAGVAIRHEQQACVSQCSSSVARVHEQMPLHCCHAERLLLSFLASSGRPAAQDFCEYFRLPRERSLLLPLLLLLLLLTTVDADAAWRRLEWRRGLVKSAKETSDLLLLRVAKLDSFVNPPCA
jgi:hypothetical protein